MDKTGREGRVEGMDLEVEMKVVVVRNQAKASAPLPALVEPDLYLKFRKKAPNPFLGPGHALYAGDHPPYP